MLSATRRRTRGDFSVDMVARVLVENLDLRPRWDSARLGHSDGIQAEYSAYEVMALKMLQEIGARTRREFAIRDIGILHRLGRLLPTECSVAIVVTGAHRAVRTANHVFSAWQRKGGT